MKDLEKSVETGQKKSYLGAQLELIRAQESPIEGMTIHGIDSNHFYLSIQESDPTILKDLRIVTQVTLKLHKEK